MGAQFRDRRSVTSLVGRLAPSPTGLLHLGHARSFLLAWWSIRARGGRIVLRLEDLDGDRSSIEMVDASRRDLEWLGVDWDSSRVQSDDGEAIEEAARRLVDAGLAYPCVCSRADVRAAQSAPHLGDREVRYPGTCRGRFVSIEEARRRTGKDAGLRFRVPDGAVTLEDEFAPPHSVDVQREVGDFLISRRNGMPAYQLAVVVDDAVDAVTEVLRGDDLLSSTQRQWHLQEALGLPHPTWVHVPLVIDTGGTRLAKRHDSLSLEEVRTRGIDARRLVGWVAQTCGMKTEPMASAREALDAFDLKRLPHDPVVVGEDILERLADP